MPRGRPARQPPPASASALTPSAFGALRPGLLSDLHAVHAIHFDPLVLGGHQRLLSVSQFRPSFARLLTFGHVFVHERDGQVVGFCMVSRLDGRAAHVARLDAFAVTPLVQGTGVAKAMLVETLTALHRAGARRLEAAIDSNNACALRFLAGQGFTVEGTLRGYLASNTLPPFADAFLLARSLTSSGHMLPR
jgi:RimJ/RimL family protein N-acetyltransferase